MTRFLLTSLFAVAPLSLVACQKSTNINPGSGPNGAVSSEENRPAATPEDFPTDPISADRATLLVYGMSCPLCATNVDQQLLAMPGVSTVNVDLSSGWVTVTFSDGAARPSERDLAKAVVESGMTIVDIETN